jgi:HSP20 family protein
MRLIRYDPFREIQGMRDQMNQWLGSIDESAGWGNVKTFSPTCDMEETENEIVVKMDVPGIDEKEITLTLSGDNLIIKGERNTEKDEKKKHFHRMERFQGTFERVLPLPLTVEKEKINAEYQKGVLEVHLPKVPEVKPKEIPIKVK